MLYKDSGFKTIADWKAAHLDKSSEGVVEMDGKAWQKITDADLMVVKKNAAGKYEVARVEQIKSGERDIAGKAKIQLDKTTDALERIGADDSSVRIVGKRDGQAIDISKQYELSNFSKDRGVTRGADDRQRFDQSLGLTSTQIKRLANEIIIKHRRSEDK